jgi:hypothetical protein
VFDAIMQVHIGKIKGVLPVRLVQHSSQMVGDKEAESGCEVVRCMDRVVYLLEADVFAISGQDP